MAGKHPDHNSGNKLYVYSGSDGETDSGDSYNEQSPFLDERWSPGSVGTLHRFSDLDSSQLSQHHTLGPSRNQSSPGNHNHNGGNSKALFHAFSGSGTTSASGGLLINTGAPFSTVSAAVVQYDQTSRSGGPFCSAIWYDTWTSTNPTIGTQWYNGTTQINAGTVYYRGVVFP